jgi:protein arginine kinase activator
MKCENCGKNEVTFVYQSNLNGKITEKHLCSDCAEKLGYTQKLMANSQRMMQNFFGGGFFDDFFMPTSRLLGGMDRFFGEDLFDDFFSEMPALGAAPAEQEEQKTEQKDNLVNQEEQSKFARMREMNALRMELRKAVHKEDFERAAQLRDQIHAMEKGQNQTDQKNQ